MYVQGGEQSAVHVRYLYLSPDMKVWFGGFSMVTESGPTVNVLFEKNLVYQHFFIQACMFAGNIYMF